ncbi:serine/threonine-protein kinase [Archangium gephyra]|uniref:Serine/threonine protein kinase PrkC, regulator of stationary phase n=1 Tax=Archangium gephyra TaxID=48 RepID=A0AAC8Q5U6_9BACT|nr:protein kinase [Archangium gephyra]AKJ01586.1 Serine/threonine protein kinase PrkC, regulator of stationary phase [Archangium gephyra]REG34403.1 serine/threonine-protein kinase [Archangium gephyra]
MTTPDAGKVAGGSPDAQLRAYGQYVLVRKLAEGGMAEIFLAKRVGADGFERNVVIKRMLAHLSGMPEFVEMFRDEARLAAKLSHPNIVQIQDLGFTDGCYYICMEYLPGEDFSTTVRTASFRGEYVPVPLVMRVLADAARGLHYAHEFADETGRRLNIVHRDISPSNLYVTYEGQVKVLDFGISKYESRQAQTRTGVVKGKYIYMAPEQARGAQVDRRADVFALGVSLYEALTHVRPFARDNDLAVLSALLDGDFQPPRELRPDLSPELEMVVLRAMAYDPEERYPTAAEFADDLEHLLSKEPQRTTGSELAAYLRGSFGEERYGEKTRIPTLTTLKESGLSIPETVAGSSMRLSGTMPSVSSETRTGVVPPPPGTNGAMAGSSRWRGVVAGVVAGCLLLAGGAFVVGRRFGTAPAEPVAQLPQPVVQAAPPPTPVSPPAPTQPAPASPEAALPGSVVAAVAEAAPSAQVPPAQTALAAAPESTEAPPAEQAEPPAAKAPSRTQKRVTLEAADIQKVVSRNRARIMSCFEQFKRDLPSDEGNVQVRFTIFSSGKADAATQGPLATRPVGKCLEKQVERLRFPAHRDKEVTVVLPFGYRVTR